MNYDISINDDYAGVWLNDNTYLYYGYEYLWNVLLDKPYIYNEDTEDNDTEWCFVVKKDGKIIHQVRAAILSDSTSDYYKPDRMLLKGIAWWIQKEKLL